MGGLEDLLFQQQRAARAVLEAEEASTDAQAKHDELVAAMQPHQRQLHQSTARFDAVVTARQVGKTWGVLLLIFAACVLRKSQRWVIIGPTLKALKRNYLPAFNTINAKFGLGVVFNKTDHEFHFPNGSIVYLHGADTGEAIDRIRGGTFHGVAVDEAQLYPLADLEMLVDDVVIPTLKILRGRLILVGTPGPVLDGQFYLATCTPPEIVGLNKEPSNYAYGDEPTGLWCKHTWPAQANLAAPHAWEEGLRLKTLKGWADDHPKWLREYCGVWAADLSSLVYLFDTTKNTYDGTLPNMPKDKPWRYLLGADLGQADGTAIVVWAYSEACPVLYEVYSGKRKNAEGQRISMADIAAWRQELVDTYGEFIFEVCDAGGLGQMVLDEFNDTYGFFWEPAEKRLKEDYIALFNDDLEYGRIKVRKAAVEYRTELGKNAWAKDRQGYVPPVGRRTENPATPNDICDAGLYAFRAAYHRLYRAPVGEPEIPDAYREMHERWRLETLAIIEMHNRGRRNTDETEVERICSTLDN